MTMRRHWWKSFVALVTSLLLVLSAPSVSFADVDEVNTSKDNSCPAILSGKPGVAFSIESARKLRNAAEILLPACAKERDLLGTKVEVKDLYINAAKDINADLRDALAQRKEESKELRSVKTGILTSRVFWVVVGVVIGAGATIGIGYARK